MRSPHLKVLYWIGRHQQLAYLGLIATATRTLQESFGASPQAAHVVATFAVDFAIQCGFFEGGRGGD